MHQDDYFPQEPDHVDIRGLGNNDVRIPFVCLEVHSISGNHFFHYGRPFCPSILGRDHQQL